MKETATTHKPGERLADGTIYAGLSPDDGTAMYVMPKDAPLTCTLNEAAEYVGKLNREKYLGYDDWRVPTKNEPCRLFDNSAAIGGFDESGDGPGACYWSSLGAPDITWSQRFSDGAPSWNGRYMTASLRCVRG